MYCDRRLFQLFLYKGDHGVLSLESDGNDAHKNVLTETVLKTTPLQTG
ncbi:hypothetical protein SGQ83_21580 [Flavobacterium sp. Fl-318]|uniref:Uncharacterized protein n=1 Tax=Flavobacterium cupriresistens TaxID=2893885 RepID=A0ABU4RH93_9FLAO|nr:MULTISPECIES: hypothetical protein [unclassified Flavobacterium]MDX6191954.1 hypothetical protein [Flavobacterium sp. Fl-318]UFH44593.1 hypothetical protein LNP23_10380 [Flavobacterium sp. F-323]